MHWSTLSHLISICFPEQTTLRNIQSLVSPLNPPAADNYNNHDTQDVSLGHFKQPNLPHQWKKGSKSHHGRSWKNIQKWSEYCPGKTNITTRMITHLPLSIINRHCVPFPLSGWKSLLRSRGNAHWPWAENRWHIGKAAEEKQHLWETSMWETSVRVKRRVGEFGESEVRGRRAGKEEDAEEWKWERVRKEEDQGQRMCLIV